MKSSDIFQSIIKFEGDLVTAKRSKKSADAALAQAYASGGATGPALKVAVDSIAAVYSMVSALPDLDRQYFMAAKAEHDSAYAAVWAKKAKALAAIKAKLAPAMTAIRATFTEILEGAPLPELMEKLEEFAVSTADEALTNRASVELRACPALPNDPPKRSTVSGLPLVYQLGNFVEPVDPDGEAKPVQENYRGFGLTQAINTDMSSYLDKHDA